MNSSAADCSFGYYHPNPRSSTRIFCFPHAGSGLFPYRNWAVGLPEFEVCPVQLPGHGHLAGEPLLTQCSELVTLLANRIGEYADKQFVFFGHSMGALLGFEVARALRRQKRPGPRHLFVSGRPAPQLPHRPRKLSELPTEEFIAELKRLNGTPPEVFAWPEMVEAAIPVLRADFRVIENYSYADEPPLDCPLSVYGGRADTIKSKELEAWRKQTLSSFRRKMFSGDHFFINSCRDHVLARLAAELR